MKRILFVSWYSGLGGGETELITLADSLANRHFIPHLLLPREGPLSARWRERKRPVHITPFRGATTYFVPAIWARFPVVQRFVELIKQQQIDVVHCDYHSSPLVVPAARRGSVPALFTVSGWWYKPKSWQREFFRGIPAIVARTNAIRVGFLGSPPFMPADDLPVIYSGVDTERFRPDGSGRALRQEIGIDSGAPVVAMVARFQRVKGHHTFQEMAAGVARQMPEAHFVVAGDDAFGVAADRRYRDQMLRSAANHPLLRDRLHYIGFRDEVEAVYAAADVVVCASSFESYGIANLEAMASGKPVVSTRHGGPAETILQGETGFLVDPSDTGEMARMVCELLADRNLRERMGRAGRERVLRHFSTEAAADAYVEIIEALTLPS